MDSIKDAIRSRDTGTIIFALHAVLDQDIYLDEHDLNGIGGCLNHAVWAAAVSPDPQPDRVEIIQLIKEIREKYGQRIDSKHVKQ